MSESSAGVSARLIGFVRALRAHGILAGPGETLDAAAALEVLGLTGRERMREGLAAALIRHEGQRAVFDATFDLYFPLGVGASERSRQRAEEGDNPAGLWNRLADALASDDQAELGQLAAEAVGALGWYGQASGAGGWSAYQTLDRLQPQTLLVRVRAAIRAARADEAAFTDRLDTAEIRRRIEGFRKRVRTEAVRRTAELHGPEQIAQHAIAPTTDRADFLNASRAQLAELRRSVHPLARKLATRLAARRRRAARGQMDLRRTLRRSLSTGGVPVWPAYHRHRPGRPEIVLLCDVSGSVAGFANFTMLLVQALHDQFSKLRVFAFVNRTDEVTHLIKHGSADPEHLGTSILAEATLTGWDGHSDYGAALGQFAARYCDAIGPRTSVLILGDARTNGSDPNLPALRRITDNARTTHWLNPERAALWPIGDSAAHDYSELVEMHECRNADQLSKLVARLLPV